MRTYIVYENDKEVYRAGMPDCAEYVMNEHTYSQINKITFVIMMPAKVRYDDIAGMWKEKMFSKTLTLNQRLKLNEEMVHKWAA